MLKLTKHERWLRNLYKNVLTMCNSQRAIREGDFFDLMYVNLSNPALDPHRQFAYLRHKDDETIMIIVNFGDRQADVAVNIPDHAFDFLELAEGSYDAVELLSENTGTIDLQRGTPFTATVPAHGAILCKLTPRK